MIITVEGNIGAGKSSFAKALYEELNNVGQRVVHIPEPVDAWTDFHGTNLLELMYKDRQRWSFTFQVNALLHTIRCEEQAVEYVKKGFIVVRERSSDSVRWIFTPLVSEYMSAAENIILDDLCKRMKSPACWNVVIYLRTDPEICYERIQRRGRPEELCGRIDMSYLTKLHNIYENVMVKSNVADDLIIGDGNAFNITDPKTVKVVGADDTVLNSFLFHENTPAAKVKKVERVTHPSGGDVNRLF